MEYQNIINDNNFNLEDDLHNGQIYLIKNKINNKCYIGQAACFVGSNNNKWGTFGRWKSHLKEAFKIGDDHCIILNNAIRKYGENNFEISTLIKCKMDDLNDYEIEFIKKYNSLQPNGYNIKEGGYKSKNSEDTILKMKESHYGKEHSEKTKIKIGKSQIGNRRTSIIRKNSDDNILPKYIISFRENNILKGYKINCFPIGINEKKYLVPICFSIVKYNTKENALEAAINHLDKLKEEYKYIEKDINIIKEENNKISAKEKKENLFKEKLPEYIHPIIEENKIKGYYVDNIINNDGKKYPKRIFNENTNRWNLDKANKFVEILKYINKNNVDMKNFNIEDIDINDIEKSFYDKFFLPKYFNIYRAKGEIIGFCINGFPNDNYKDGKYKKEFRLKKDGKLEDIYEEGITFLKNL